MFHDIKGQLDNHVVREIMAASAFDPSPEAMNYKAAEFRRHESWQLYGWVENGVIVGACGFEVHKDYVEILNIAVAENFRYRGIGGKMITALWKKYEMAIEAETDDDAVDFYRKRGFQATAIQKYNVRRWTCVLAAPKPLDQVKNNNWIEEILKDRSIVLIGFADLSEIDTEIRYGYQYGICIAIALKVFPSATNEPSKEYYDEYKNVSARLREASDFLAEKIKERGFNAYSLAHERQNEAYRTQLPLKTLATRAGLGWIGKSAVLITKEYGNAIRLNGVLTDLPIKVGTPVNESFCGECDKCVKHCPGHAITGNTWRLHIDRDILLDAVSCKKAVIERGKVFNVADGTCGICISVCPWTKRYRLELE